MPEVKVKDLFPQVEQKEKIPQDLIIGEIQTVINTINGTYKIDHSTEWLESIYNNLRDNIWNYLPAPLKKFNPDKKTLHWTENPRHQLTIILNHFISLIKNDFPRWIDESNDYHDFITVFMDDIKEFINTNELSLTNLDGEEVNNLLIKIEKYVKEQLMLKNA